MLTHIPTIALLSTTLITITLCVSKWGAKVIESPRLKPIQSDNQAAAYRSIQRGE